MLWLHRNLPEEFDDSAVNQAVLDRGNAVGDLAMGLLGDYVEVPFGDLSEMIRRTREPCVPWLYGRKVKFRKKACCR
jgi:hypothetical protein